jgi:hypothetical protein
MEKLQKCLPRSDAKGLRFWCADCKKWHYHGIVEGERVSHCVDRKVGEGYTIRMFSIKELTDIRDAINDYLALSREEREVWKHGS